MPIKIPDNLPAFSILEKENIFVMAEGRATTQDIRPLRLAIMNLMPTKIATETQLLRLLGNTPLQVDITLLQSETHDCRNTDQQHLDTFYKTFSEIRHLYFDGLIITGAPIEFLDFEKVDYWDELTEIMDWSLSHVFSTWHICWAATAGLYHHYGVPKQMREEKIFGIYPHSVCQKFCPLFRGFDDVFYVPHSRYFEIRKEDVDEVPELMIEASSPESGIYIISAMRGRQFFVTGHSEYDWNTLKNEFDRDIAKGVEITPPAHYFPDDDPSKDPWVSWRGHGNLLYQNWLNYYVYQATPYDLDHEPDFSLYI